ncbi:hypothetical protein [Winogradskyella luteola]|uniref:Outer membrane protein beta-barrel domain-containing protein n=1 Tax=Winogradskyella luteola TaxID=2828330 RepID=A0A9X1FD50_9FLAO|nr:hypothetical protein [Winogradskyella luteola]MBV7270710.1 hypothetical protein [Winogradskyella luteola]
MKTKTVYYLTFVLTMLVCIQSHAQNRGTLLNPFLGIAGTRGSDEIRTPSFGATAEFFLDETFSVGAIVTYSTVEPEVSFTDEDTQTNGLTIGAFANYYWTDSESFNFYTGIGLGYDGHDGPYVDGSIYFEIHAGGRYQLSENLGLFAELGYGLALFKLGMSFKL